MKNIDTAQDAITLIEDLYDKNREKRDNLRVIFRASLNKKQLKLLDELNLLNKEFAAITVMRNSSYGIKL